MKITYEMVEDKESSAHLLKERFLKQQGWNHYCDLPGSMWYWKKEFNGKLCTMTTDDAFYVEKSDLDLKGWSCFECNHFNKWGDANSEDKCLKCGNQYE